MHPLQGLLDLAEADRAAGLRPGDSGNVDKYKENK